MKNYSTAERDVYRVVVSTSVWHAGSISGHGMHGIFGVKTWFSTLGTCVSCES